jgi:hypothetical protein
MRDLELERAWLVYPGKQSYFLGEGIDAVPAVAALSPTGSA